MNRMSVSRFVRSTLIVGLLLTSYSFAYGEEVVRFQLKSGDTITGELL